MRTRPLPNRHAADLSDFMECVQATLNRNRAKGDLGDMTCFELVAKTREEFEELVAAMGWLEWTREAVLLGRTRQIPKPQEVEHEAADLAICALSAWMWARRGEHVSGG